MKMNGEQRIAAPIEVVWAALNDADVLRACIPGCQSLEPVDEDAFRAAATIKVGPISARFGGMVKLFDRVPPHSYRISGEGSGGAAGAVKGAADVHLVADGDATILQYDVSADITGRLAQLGGKLIDITAKQLAGIFFARFSQEVVERQAEATATTAVHMDQMTAHRPEIQPVSSPAAIPQPGSTGAGSTPTGISLLLLFAAAIGGFTLGETAGDWDASGNLGGAAVGLLVIVVAAAAFLLGQRAARPTTTVSLDADTIARLARAMERQHK